MKARSEWKTRRALLKLEPSIASASGASPSECDSPCKRLALDARDRFAATRHLACAARRDRTSISHSGFGVCGDGSSLPARLRIEADIRDGRREILRSPIYRSLVASRQSMWVGHGRDFERLREYQPGDNYAEIAWKSTARRSAPVTRLFQWEQKQEVYFAVDQSRASALPIHLAPEGWGTNSRGGGIATHAGSERRNGSCVRDGRAGIGRRIRTRYVRGRTEIVAEGGKRSIPFPQVSRRATGCRAPVDNGGLRSVVQRDSSAIAAASLSGRVGGPHRAVGFRFVATRNWTGSNLARCACDEHPAGACAAGIFVRRGNPDRR